MTLLFVNNLHESLDIIWRPRMLAKKKDFIGGFSYINIYLRF